MRKSCARLVPLTFVSYTGHFAQNESKCAALRRAASCGRLARVWYALPGSQVGRLTFWLCAHPPNLGVYILALSQPAVRLPTRRVQDTLRTRSRRVQDRGVLHGSCAVRAGAHPQKTSCRCLARGGVASCTRPVTPRTPAVRLHAIRHALVTVRPGDRSRAPARPWR